jgi:hypothetical protein
MPCCTAGKLLEAMIKLHRIGLFVVAAFLSCSCGIFSSSEPLNPKQQEIKDKLCTPEFSQLLKVSHEEILKVCPDDECRNAENFGYMIVTLQLHETCAKPLVAVPSCSPRCDIAEANNGG